jgi:uncharacterized protein YqgQ
MTFFLIVFLQIDIKKLLNSEVFMQAKYIKALSIKHIYAERIVSGVKTIEL